MKKNKILIARVVIILLTIFIIAIGLMKLEKHLEGPAMSFYNTVSSAVSDFKNADIFTSTDIYEILNGRVTANIDTKISTTGINGTKYENYRDMLNASYISKINLDKEKNYLDASLKVTHNNREYDIDYFEKDDKKYIMGSNEVYKELGLDSYNLKSLDKNIYIAIIETIANVLNKIDVAYIKVNDGKTMINSVEYDTSKATYNMTQAEYTNLINNIIIAMSNNTDITNYYNRTYNVDNTKFVSYIRDKINSTFNNHNTYTINTYVVKNNNTPVKIDLMGDGEELCSYIFSGTYHNLKFGKSNYTLKSNGNNYTLTMINDKNVVFDYKKENAASTGTIKVNDLENKELYNLSYDYTIVTGEDSTKSIGLNIKLNPTSINSGLSFEFKSAILVTPNATINYLDVKDYINATTKDMTFSSYIDEYLEKSYNYFTQTNENTDSE